MVSNSGIWQPTTEEVSKKIAGSCEVTALALKAGGGAAVISLYDGNSTQDVTLANKKWVLDASTSDSDNQSFASPIIFKKGVFAVCEQGMNVNPILCIATRKYTP